MRRESIILTDSILQESKYLFKKKLTNCPKYSWCSAKVDLNTQVFMVLSKRVVGARQNLVSIKARRDIHHDGLFDLSVFLLCF